MEKERTMEGKQMKWLEYYKGKTVLVTGHTGFKAVSYTHLTLPTIA